MTRTDRVRTVLFDLDGTLIDSRELILSSYRHTMRVHRGEVPPDREWLAGMGTPLLTQLRGFAADEEQARAMMDTYREHNLRVHDRMVRTFEGARETVEWMLERGLALGIVTSKLRRTALRGLSACGLELEWFQAMVTPDDDIPHKPDPAPVRLALERMGESRPERTLFVGDSVWDLRAGRSAATRTAAALWGAVDREAMAAEKPDHLVERPPDLRTVVRPAREPA